MRHLILLFLLISLSAKAQPNVTQAHLPAVGNELSLSFSFSNEPWDVNSGPNQNWNLSRREFEPSSNPLNYQAASSLAGGNLFPLATMGFAQGDAHFFLRSGASGLEQVGYYYTRIRNPTLAKVTYQPPLRVIPLGLALNQTQNTTSKRVSYDSVDANTFTKTIGTHTQRFSFVAWGNLTLPGSGPKQVMVLQTDHTSVDSIFTSTTGISGNYTFTEIIEEGDVQPSDYMFIQAGNPALLLSASTVDNGDGDVVTTFVQYSNGPLINVKEKQIADAIAVFPNPSIDGKVVIKAKNPIFFNSDIQVFNSLGKQVKFTIEPSQNGETQLQLLHSKPGFYLIKCAGENGETVSKLMVQ